MNFQNSECVYSWDKRNFNVRFINYVTSKNESLLHYKIRFRTLTLLLESEKKRSKFPTARLSGLNNTWAKERANGDPQSVFLAPFNANYQQRERDRERKKRKVKIPAGRAKKAKMNLSLANSSISILSSG